MYCKERSLLYNTYLFYKLSELEKCLKDYMTLLSTGTDSTNNFDYTYRRREQLEILDILKEAIEEINLSKILPDYLLQPRIQRRHGWTGLGIKNFPSFGALK